MTRRLRLVEDGPRPGTVNMATDEALATAGSAGYAATLRFYGWSPPAVSLGHNQADSMLDPAALRAAGWDLVRRPTGGMAVLHHQEITLALTAPDLDAWGWNISQSVALLAGAVAEFLRLGGIPAASDPGRPPASPRSSPAGGACFSGGGRHEVWVDGTRKIAGLAARRWGRSLLVHGSFLTGPAHVELARLLDIPESERGLLMRSLAARTACLADFGWTGLSLIERAPRGIGGLLARAAGAELVPASLESAEEEAVHGIMAREAGRPDPSQGFPGLPKAKLVEM